MTWKAPITAVVLVLGLCAALLARAAQFHYYPWELVSSGLNGALKSLGYSPGLQVVGPATGPGAPAGVLFAGGDDGGAWRSLDCGAHWEHVNGGPGVTEGTNGGYGCDANTTCVPHRVIYYGPPGLNQMNTSPSDFAASVLPQGAAALGGSHATYRTGRNLWWSNSGGDQWYPLSTYCLGISGRFPSGTGTATVAADTAGAAFSGHLVATSGAARRCRAARR